MNKLSPRHIVVAAALFGIAAQSAWSEEATPGEPADSSLVRRHRSSEESVAGRRKARNSKLYCK